MGTPAEHMGTLDNTTGRATADELEALLEQAIPVLDHGFIRVIDYMGDDHAIVQAARVSYGKGTKQKSQDRGLINYLMRHRHTTPFEMCEIKFHLKMPLFVARQWLRHRTANVNEYSARYSIVEDQFYIPELDQIAAQSASNNQGRGETIPPDMAQKIQNILKEDSEKTYQHYQYMINGNEAGEPIHEEHPGIARELARMNLPVNVYTQMYWKIDLHNLLHFLSLRADHHAQYEIRIYAEKMLDIVKAWVPMAYDAFMNYRMHGILVSKSGIDVIRRHMTGEIITQESSNLSAREWQELCAQFPELCAA